MALFSFLKKNKKQNDDSHIIISSDECVGCEKCITACQNNVLIIADGKSSVHDYRVCKSCRVCMAICPNNCIKIK